MTDELRRCPNCGAYVMSSDDLCPRCDYDLRGPADGSSPPSAPATEIFTVPGKSPSPTAIYDVADLVAAQQNGLVPVPPDITVRDLPAAPASAEPETVPESEPLPVPSPSTMIYPAAASAEQVAAPDEDPDLTDILPMPTPARGALPDVEPVFRTRKSVPQPRSVPEVARTPAREPVPSPREPVPPVPPVPEPVRIVEPAIDGTELPTMGVEGEPAHPATPTAPPAPMQTTLPAQGISVHVPPAPYTPPPTTHPLPPARIAPPAPSYVPPGSAPAAPSRGADAGIAYVQQRVAAYRQGGYRVLTYGQYDASLTRGKPMGVGVWLLALLTGIGVFWYLLILAVSGFQRDAVYIMLEDDGRVYEDGPGAAHIRRGRARAGRRWSAIGMLALFLGLLAAVLLSVIAGVVLTQERYQAALREAYPAVTLFEEQFSTAQADADDVPLLRDGAIVFAIAALITFVFVWGGGTLLVIGTVHAAAYGVRVPALPEWA